MSPTWSLLEVPLQAQRWSDLRSIRYNLVSWCFLHPLLWKAPNTCLCSQYTLRNEAGHVPQYVLQLPNSSVPKPLPRWNLDDPIVEKWESQKSGCYISIAECLGIKVYSNHNNFLFSLPTCAVPVTNSALESLSRSLLSRQSDKGSWKSLCSTSSASALPHNSLLHSGISLLYRPAAAASLAGWRLCPSSYSTSSPSQPKGRGPLTNSAHGAQCSPILLLLFIILLTQTHIQNSPKS